MHFVSSHVVVVVVFFNRKTLNAGGSRECHTVWTNNNIPFSWVCFLFHSACIFFLFKSDCCSVVLQLHTYGCSSRIFSASLVRNLSYVVNTCPARRDQLCLTPLYDVHDRFIPITHQLWCINKTTFPASAL